MNSRRLSIPSQRNSTVGDDDTYEVIPTTTRQPLIESTGNAQPHNNHNHLASLLCHQSHPLALSPSGHHHSIPTPPIVPTQAITSTYGTSLRGQPSYYRDVSLRESSTAHSRGGQNPIYSWKHFADYRAKVTQKESENEELKWPLYLEDAFLDVHFFFPRRNDKEEEEARNAREDEGEAESFKNNRVLISLADGQLPDERPNYDYFARLLGADSEVFVRPKVCWIYVSSSEVKLSDDCSKAFTADGTCLSADGYTADGMMLESKGDYPYLIMNSNKEVKRELGHGKDGAPNYLLHEYTKSLSQKESSSIRDISSRWDQNFPDLHDKLLSALDDVHPSHERTSRCVLGPCDTINFEVVLDLHATSQFPSGTHLDGVVQLSICRPELHRHSWRSVTTVVKPAELDLGEAESHNFQNECEITGRGDAGDTIEVPFPATSWAKTFIKLAPYVTAERERKERGRLMKEGGGRKVKEEDDNNNSNNNDVPSQKGCKNVAAKDLLQQVAMYQEIWSSPNDGSEKRSWTRRAVILWTFVNVHSKTDEKGKVSTVPAGTTWRFLTKVDPTSQYHQQRAYVTGSPTIPRDSVMSPSPGYQHHLNAAMHENFSSAAYHDTTTATSTTHALHTLPNQQPHSNHSHLSSLSILDNVSSYPSGLATPPPTASLQPSYAHSFDSATIASNDSLQLHLSLLSDTSTTESQPTTLAADHTMDTFLAGLGVPVSTYEELECDPNNLQMWATTAVDAAAQWGATSYVDGQQSLAWADHGVATTTAVDVSESQWSTSRDNTPWHDDKDTLWATGTTNTISSPGKGADAWNALDTCQPWLQGIAAVADATTTTNTFGRASLSSSSGGGWDEHMQQHHHHLVGSRVDHHYSYSPPPPPDSSQFSLMTLKTGSRKRAREDSVEDRENYPLHSVRKLKHESNVPAAVIDDGGHHQLF